MLQEKNWFTISQAAKYLGVSSDTLRRWEKAGKISSPKRTAGGARRYSKGLLDEILGGGRKEERTKTIEKKTSQPAASKKTIVTA